MYSERKNYFSLAVILFAAKKAKVGYYIHSD